MITEDHVNFEIAKLLKEKGFNEECFALYNPDGMLIKSGIRLNNIQVGRVKGSYSAPTLQMAMKWLREVHMVNIEIHYNRFGENYKYLIIYKPEVLNDIRSLGVFYYYEEACETAIKYCLENLI